MQEGMSAYSWTQTYSLALFCQLFYIFISYFTFYKQQVKIMKEKKFTGRSFGCPVENTKNCPDFCMRMGTCMGAVSYRLCYQYKDPFVVFRLNS